MESQESLLDKIKKLEKLQRVLKSKNRRLLTENTRLDEREKVTREYSEGLVKELHEQALEHKCHQPSPSRKRTNEIKCELPIKKIKEEEEYMEDVQFVSYVNKIPDVVSNRHLSSDKSGNNSTQTVPHCQLQDETNHYKEATEGVVGASNEIIEGCVSEPSRDEMKRLQSKILSLEHEKDELRDSLDINLSEKESLGKNLGEVRAANKKLVQDQLQLKSKISLLEDNLATSSFDLNGQVEELEDGLNKMQAQNWEITEELKTWKEYSEELEKELAELKECLNKKENGLVKSEMATAKFRDNIKSLKLEIEQKNETLGRLRDELKLVRGTVKSIDTEKMAIKESNKELKKSNEELEKNSICLGGKLIRVNKEFDKALQKKEEENTEMRLKLEKVYKRKKEKKKEIKKLTKILEKVERNEDDEDSDEDDYDYEDPFPCEYDYDDDDPHCDDDDLDE